MQELKALEVLRKRQKILKGEVGGCGYNKDAEYRMVTDRNLSEVNEAISELETLQEENEHLKNMLEEYKKDKV